MKAFSMSKTTVMTRGIVSSDVMEKNDGVIALPVLVSGAPQGRC